MTKTEKIQASIDAFSGNAGPVTWSAEEREDGGSALIATYPEHLELEDEPWAQFGGDAILQASGFDRYGDNMVSQWAIVKND